MPRKTLDIDPELDALKARMEKRRTEHKLALGEIVLESGLHKLFDADQLKDALLRLRDEAAAALRKEVTADPSGSNFPAAATKPNGHGAEPARHRASDLLGQAAAE